MYQALVKRGVRFPAVPAQQTNAQGGQGGTRPQPASSPRASNTDSKGGETPAPSNPAIPAKFNKLVNDMNLVKGNINFTNEIIDQTQPGENSETLEDLFRTLTQLEPKLINMISQIDDDGVMAMCLIVNDDLHKTFERFRAIKKGKKPQKFIPGESTQQTFLNPSHIYTASSVSEENKSQKSDNQSAPQ